MAKKQISPKPVPQPVQKEESYFVSIKSPLECRRQILEASRKSIYCLQNYQRVLLLRERKIKEIGILKHSIRELIFLDGKLNEKLPKYNTELLHEVRKITKETESAFKEFQAVERKSKPDKTKTKAEKSDLEKLEDALANIEGKLRNLNN